MKRVIFFSIAEVFLILTGWIAWIVKPTSTIAIAIGWGVAVGVSVPMLIRDIKRALFWETHKDEIMADMINHLEKEVLKRKLTKKEKGEIPDRMRVE